MLVTMLSFAALYAVGDNTNYTLGFESDAIQKQFAEVFSGEVRELSSSGTATFILDASGDVYVLGRNLGYVLCQPDESSVVKIPQSLNLGFRAKAVAVSGGSAMILSEDNSLYGCGSNLEGKLSLVGERDSAPFLLRQIPLDAITGPVQSLQSNAHNLFLQTKTEVYYTGPAGSLSPITSTATSGTQRVLLQPLPVLEEGFFRVFPGTLTVTRRNDSLTFIFGADPCLSRPETAIRGFYRFGFSHAEQFWIAEQTAVSSQGNVLPACGFYPENILGFNKLAIRSGLYFGEEEETEEIELGEVFDVTARNRSVVVLAEKGLFVAGQDPLVTGECEKNRAGICGLQKIADVAEKLTRAIVTPNGVLVFSGAAARSFYIPQIQPEEVVSGSVQVAFLRSKGFEPAAMPVMRSVAVTRKGILGVTLLGQTWRFGLEDALQLGGEYCGAILKPQVARYFQDAFVGELRASESEMVAVTASGGLFTAGYNVGGALGKPIYPGGDEEQFSPPKQIEVEDLDAEMIREIAVVERATFLRTDEGIVFFGECQGQCGTLNGEPLFDTGERDQSQLTAYSLPMKAEEITRIVGLERQFIILQDNGSVYGAGANDLGQLCQSLSLNIREKLVPPTKLGMDFPRLLAIGEQNSVFLSSDNKILGCGKNSNGEFALFPTIKEEFVLKPQEIEEEFGNVLSIAVDRKLIFVLSDKGLYVFGDTDHPEQYGFSKPQPRFQKIKENPDGIFQSILAASGIAVLSSIPETYLYPPRPPKAKFNTAALILILGTVAVVVATTIAAFFAYRTPPKETRTQKRRPLAEQEEPRELVV